jgi:hypothetical protein
VFGFKAHTGWAAVVVLAGSASAPEVVLKRRVQMAADFGEAAAYHASQELSVAKAEALIGSAEAKFERSAHAAIGELIEELRLSDREAFASAIVGGQGKPLPSLESILRSHALVHAAEGELFRRVIAQACAAHRLQTLFVPAKELSSRAAKALGLSATQLALRLAQLGKTSGRPWAQDQKESALAAWTCLVDAGGEKLRAAAF